MPVSSPKRNLGLLNETPTASRQTLTLKQTRLRKKQSRRITFPVRTATSNIYMDLNYLPQPWEKAYFSLPEAATPPTPCFM